MSSSDVAVATTSMWPASAIGRSASGFNRLRAALHALRSFPVVSHDKARRELGYQPRPIATTVLDTAAWFVAHGWLDPRRVAVPLPEPAR